MHLGVDVDFRPARKAHPALLVRGLDALAEQLRAAGVATTAGDEEAQLYVDDPSVTEWSSWSGAVHWSDRRNT